MYCFAHSELVLKCNSQVTFFRYSSRHFFIYFTFRLKENSILKFLIIIKNKVSNCKVKLRHDPRNLTAKFYLFLFLSLIYFYLHFFSILIQALFDPITVKMELMWANVPNMMKNQLISILFFWLFQVLTCLFYSASILCIA